MDGRIGIGAALGVVLVSVSGLLGCASEESAIVDATGELVGDGPSTCAPMLTCAAPKLAASKRSWRNPLKSLAISLKGPPNHRGRDLFLGPGAPQTIIAQFAYGPANVDLVDEDIDVFVQRDCTRGWEKLGTGTTTASDTHHDAVEGVGDHGGRLYFEIPPDKQLGPGQHRVRLVVAGDASTIDLLLDVVPPNTPMFVTDVDGTLTVTEEEEFLKIFGGKTPDAHPKSAEALRALVAKGYRPMYLTARPEWLTQRTREFLDERGFPPGVVHTSLEPLGGGFGDSAAAFKTAELDSLKSRGLAPSWGFGNMQSDVTAYASVLPQADRRIMMKLAGAFDGRRIESYADILPELARTKPAVCK